MESALKFYLAFATEKEESWISSGMAGTVPTSMHDSIVKGVSVTASVDREELSSFREITGKILDRTTRRLGLLGPKARENLGRHVEFGTGIEVAHQPKYLGGERFVYNKLACGAALSALDSESYPFFYLADYDKVHPELTKAHFSLVNGPSGFSTSVDQDIERAYEGDSIAELPLPTHGHLQAQLDEIVEKYTFSINASTDEAWQRKFLAERLESAVRTVKMARTRASNYGEWFMILAGTITNIYSDHGFLFLEASDPEYRRLLVPFYERLLGSREEYVAAYKSLLEGFAGQGVAAPLREIDDRFVPFFLECPEKQCHRRRITLTAETTDSVVILQGKCDRCGEMVEIVTKKREPDLSDHGPCFTPRVETRQYLVQHTLHPGIHVAGTGETNYYTMSIPLMKRLGHGTALPVIHFYNKLTCNTFMTRKLEQDMIDMGLPGFLQTLKTLMKNVGRLNKLAIKDPDPARLQERRRKTIDLAAAQKEALKGIELACDEGLKEQGDSINAGTIHAYLANVFGKISRERHGQDAVFNWIDLCLKNGLSGMLSDYLMIYKPWFPPGLEFFV